MIVAARVRRRRWPVAAGSAEDGGDGAGDGGGGAGDERRRCGDERAALDGGSGALCSTKTKTKATAQIQSACGLYRGGPFSTGPCLEPVLKGL